ncbi:methyltransferase domain-containing protein [Pelagibacteraceae bacterium]|nr:methyltransferase domain-containing protein [Pelagibacteraceae bacterium]
MTINKKKGNWNFGKGVPEKFDNHIQKSVPFYNEIHRLIVDISSFFLFNNTNCLDIGCSTGSLFKKMHNNIGYKKIQYIGIDREIEMIKFAKKNNKNSQFKFLKKNIYSYNTKIKFSLVTSIFTIQFLNPSLRQNVFNKIYNYLDYGGAFIYFEKIRGNDARFQDILNGLYSDFKKKQKLSPSHILNKSESIRGILEPFTDKANQDFLLRAGFSDIQTIFQFLCFKGYLCIK